MKFLCSHCKAKYQIADEKVTGRTLRMTCRQCKQEIVIRGEAQAPRSSLPAAPPPNALGADFHRKLGGGARASAPPPPLPADAWHVAIDDAPVGPIRREEVARRIAAGVLHGESLAWREGLDDWRALRLIPELAVLIAPLPLPPSGVIAAQRLDIAPTGGRAGAAPAFSLEDWAPPADSSAMHPARASSLDAAQPRSGTGMPSWGVMFAAACGFAFLMSAMTILGARWLSKGVPGAPAAAAIAGPSATASTSAPQAKPEQMVIELDEIPLDEEGRTTDPRTGARSGTQNAQGTQGTQGSSAKPKAANGAKRNLTEAERDMLARMGGGTDTELARLQNDGTTSPARTGARSGGLTADELSKVVMRGRKNLQRCYETALRGSGSDDTVRLDVEITVSPSGNVTAVKTGGSGALPGMNECVQRTVKMWRFPTAGEATQTKFPLVFQPGS